MWVMTGGNEIHTWEMCVHPHPVHREAAATGNKMKGGEKKTLVLLKDGESPFD